jgi:hypothetical protein
LANLSRLEKAEVLVCLAPLYLPTAAILKQLVKFFRSMTTNNEKMSSFGESIQ